MSTSFFVAICILLLLSYIFDITSAKTKIPSVILLLGLGWTVKELTIFFNINIPNLANVLPVLGTIGLILIVLEGSLELELNKSKLPFVGKTSLISFFPILIISLSLAYAFYYFGDSSFKNAIVNAIPFAIISSAIAIPSAQNLISKNRDFITYESSLSDIFGVIYFNFMVRNAVIDFVSVGTFIFNIIITLIITVIATLSLAFFLGKIKHHVKFIPIIIMTVLIYVIEKHYHLPSLIFILLFGLFLGNLDELKHNKFIQKLRPEILDKEVHKFSELTQEISFLVRSLFFLLFGYLIDTQELFNQETILWAIPITAGIFILRFIFLSVFKLSVTPLVYIAPRGLITILLFLSIPIDQKIPLVNNSLIIQVILLSAIVMMFGLMTHTKKTEKKENEEKEENESKPQLEV
uniref:sodium:proton antiporter n=1 Tax=Flavobacterium sp. TaxID=239 RepID=UPI00404A5673